MYATRITNSTFFIACFIIVFQGQCQQCSSWRNCCRYREEKKNRRKEQQCCSGRCVLVLSGGNRPRLCSGIEKKWVYEVRIIHKNHTMKTYLNNEAKCLLDLSDRPSVSQWVIPSFRHSVIPSFRHSVIPSVRQSVSPSVRHSVSPSVHHSVSQSVGVSVARYVSQSIVYLLT